MNVGSMRRIVGLMVLGATTLPALSEEASTADFARLGRFWFNSEATVAPLYMKPLEQTIQEVSVRGKTVGWIFKTDQVPPKCKGKRGEIVLLAGLGVDAKIKGVQLVSRKEDDTYFKRLTDAFYKQFAGRRPDAALATFDAVTKATLSSQAIIKEVVLGARHLACQPKIAEKISASGTKPVDPPPPSAP